MSATIYPIEQQVREQFNGGAILENKPVQMTRDASKLQPYSNLINNFDIELIKVVVSKKTIADLKIQIIDVTGKMWLTKISSFPNHDILIKTTSISPEIYFLTVEGNNWSQTSKFVKW